MSAHLQATRDGVMQAAGRWAEARSVRLRRAERDRLDAALRAFERAIREEYADLRHDERFAARVRAAIGDDEREART